MQDKMRVSARGRLVVCVDDTKAPSEQDWDDYVELCRQVATREGQLRIVVFASSGAPNAAQRKSHTDMVKKVVDARMVVIAASAMLRGVVTAANWIGHPARAFAPDNLEDAFAHLGLNEDERAYCAQQVADAKQARASG